MIDSTLLQLLLSYLLMIFWGSVIYFDQVHTPKKQHCTSSNTGSPRTISSQILLRECHKQCEFNFTFRLRFNHSPGSPSFQLSNHVMVTFRFCSYWLSSILQHGFSSHQPRSHPGWSLTGPRTHFMWGKMWREGLKLVIIQNALISMKFIWDNFQHSCDL